MKVYAVLLPLAYFCHANMSLASNSPYNSNSDNSDDDSSSYSECSKHVVEEEEEENRGFPYGSCSDDSDTESSDDSDSDSSNDGEWSEQAQKKFIKRLKKHVGVEKFSFDINEVTGKTYLTKGEHYDKIYKYLVEKQHEALEGSEAMVLYALCSKLTLNADGTAEFFTDFSEIIKILNDPTIFDKKDDSESDSEEEAEERQLRQLERKTTWKMVELDGMQVIKFFSDSGEPTSLSLVFWSRNPLKAALYSSYDYEDIVLSTP